MNATIDIRNQTGMWVVFKLHDQSFGIAVDNVREMVSMPHVVPLPKAPAHVRGMINLRGQTMPVIDVRVLLGMNSANQDTAEILATARQGEEAHRKWLKELEDSVRENREFKLTTDPHKCNFGRWYDAFQTGDIVLKNYMKKFDAPHKQIHGLGVKARGLLDSGHQKEALELIGSSGQSILTGMIGLFTDLYALLQGSQREIGLVAMMDGKVMALAVDSVTSVESLPKETIKPLSSIFGVQAHRVVSHVARRRADDSMVMLFDPEKLAQDLPDLSEHAAPPAAH